MENKKTNNPTSNTPKGFAEQTIEELTLTKEKLSKELSAFEIQLKDILPLNDKTKTNRIKRRITGAKKKIKRIEGFINPEIRQESIREAEAKLGGVTTSAKAKQKLSKKLKDTFDEKETKSPLSESFRALKIWSAITGAAFIIFYFLMVAPFLGWWPY